MFFWLIGWYSYDYQTQLRYEYWLWTFELSIGSCCLCFCYIGLVNEETNLTPFKVVGIHQLNHELVIKTLLEMSLYKITVI